MKAPTIAAGVLLLAACGSGSSVQLQPGQWETTTRLTNVEAPGMPEEMLTAMRTQLASQAQTQSECMTAEEAQNPTRNIVNQDVNGADCTFADQTFANGNISIRAECRAPAAEGGGTMQMTMSGTYTSTTMEGQLQMTVRPAEGQAGPGPQELRMSGTWNARRTGECTSSS